ncbi:MAG: hypothetical protein KIT54_06985 [Phycisphaeraceae bacterium]|nr:hypothetical protein [Phycisphaeraceae bacterium]
MERIAQLLRILEIEPRDPFTLYSLGQEHAKRGDHEAAVGFYERCVEADASVHYAYFHMARSLEAMEDEGRAVEVLRAGLDRARADGEMKAASELSAYLDQIG